jgi:hypothetical protein
MAPTRLVLASLVLLGLPVLLGACRAATDLGHQCTMVKGSPDGGAVSIKESELPDGVLRDFISFGTAQCEDFVCVRDANFRKTGVAGADATGYCSRPCVPKGSFGCPAENSDDDKDPNKRLSCRALLLDEETLGSICTTDPGRCQQIAGTRSPYFCARTLDAGTP